MSRSLKLLAKELDVPVIAVAERTGGRAAYRETSHARRPARKRSPTADMALLRAVPGRR